MAIATQTQIDHVALSSIQEDFVKVGSSILDEGFKIIAGSEDKAALMALLGPNAAQLFANFENAKNLINAMGGNLPDIVAGEYQINADGTVTYIAPSAE